jgi:hypothetical protein
LRLLYLAAVIFLVGGTSAEAQRHTRPSLPARVRFVIATTNSDVPFSGELVGFTRDSITVRTSASDSVHALPRDQVHRLERCRDRSIGKDVGIGCVVVGALLGFVSWGSYSQGESLVDQKGGAAIGAVAGCVVGALGLLVIGVLHPSGWQPLVLPVE